MNERALKVFAKAMLVWGVVGFLCGSHAYCTRSFSSPNPGGKLRTPLSRDC
jgi:hypothetical protein